jgi:hypothetical protein
LLYYCVSCGGINQLELPATPLTETFQGNEASKLTALQ